MNQETTNTSVALRDEDVQGWSPKRRDFMRALGVTAGVAGLGGLAACGASAADTAATLKEQLMLDANFWTQVQSRFILNSNKLFMNIGTAGSMPKVVVDTYNTDNIAYATESDNGYSSFIAQRTAIAPGFGVGTDELVISGNTSDGMSKTISSINWRAGDTVITTNHEHPGGYIPLGIAVERYGIKVRQIILPAGEGEVMLNNGTKAVHNAALYGKMFRDEVLAARAAGDNVRAIMWSSPTYLTGIMLPIAEFMKVCKEFGLISICDGAHLPGMMAYDYGALGVDFMAGAAHKWQCAPGGTGILIVRNKARENAAATLPTLFPVITSSGNRSAITQGVRPSKLGSTTGETVAWADRGQYDIANVLQQIGSMNKPAMVAVAKVCAEWDAIGRKKIETYVLTLSKYTKERIVQMWGVEALYSPRDEGLLSAITSFNPFFGFDGVKNLVARTTATSPTITTNPSATIVARMGTDNIVVRNTTTPRIIGANTLQNVLPIRLSTHLWHDPADIDRALSAILRHAQDIIKAAS
jgi:isopenicillin-N epimerase